MLDETSRIQYAPETHGTSYISIAPKKGHMAGPNNNSLEQLITEQLSKEEEVTTYQGTDWDVRLSIMIHGQ